ncbi:MAG TPA: hypothetical protein VFU10_02700, partial [Gaiellaceae bacterium]|nr:hypothetical protein [Gaiellaceae bacterium]
PARAELGGEPRGRAVAAPSPPFGIRRDWDERIDVGTANGRSDHLAGKRRDTPAALLLPAHDQRPDDGVVRHRGARRREREPPAGALAAASDGPPRRGSAALAERRRQPRERREAAPAELIGNVTADEAAPG